MEAHQKQITVHAQHAESAPVIYLPVVMGDGTEVYERCRELNCPPFTLVGIGSLNWNRELSPLGMRRYRARCRALWWTGRWFS